MIYDILLDVDDGILQSSRKYHPNFAAVITESGEHKTNWLFSFIWEMLCCDDVMNSVQVQVNL